jgi:hypothetical protein
MLCGGASDVKEINDEVIEICNKVKTNLEEKLGSPCGAWEPKSYKQQVYQVCF